MTHDPNNMTHRLSTKTIILIVSAVLFSILFTMPAFAANLPVPHTSQAPYGDWRQPWFDACEETSIVMVDAYYREYPKKNLNKKIARAKILELFKKKNKTIGWGLDENANKVVKMINKFYDWQAKTVKKPTIEMIKEEIDGGHPVIIPAYGRALKNPRFKQGGPDYHMFVVSGYDDKKKEFIVQEPGTRYGLDFRYKYDTVMNAMHDFHGRGKTKTGQKVAIFTMPT